MAVEDRIMINEADKPRIQWVSVDEAQAMIWGDNMKLHDIGALTISIEKHGFQELPKYDEKLRGIKSGNGRIEAVYRLYHEGSRETPPRGIAIDSDGTWYVPILFGTDAVSENAAKAYAVDANNLTMLGGDFTVFDMATMWEGEAYKDLVREVAEAGEWFASMDGDDIDALLDDDDELLDLEEQDPGDYDDDDSPYDVEEGQIWLLGDHRLAVGDCLDINLVDRLLDGNKIDMVVTDPPYNVDYGAHTFGAQRPEKWGRIENDDMANFATFCLDAAMMVKYAMNKGAIYVFSGFDKRSWPIRDMFAEQFDFVNTLVWVKDTFVIGWGDYQSGYETIHYFRNGDRTWNGGRGASNVINLARSKKHIWHPTEKPRQIFETLIRNSSNKGDRVLDPFAGSGTAIMACENTRRIAYCIEKDPKWVRGTLARWYLSTNIQPVLEVSDE